MKLSAVVDAVIAALVERGLIAAPESESEPDVDVHDEPVAPEPTVDPETVKTARALAIRVRSHPPMRVAEFTHGVPPGFIEAAVAHAVERQWVTQDDGLLHAGPVSPTLREEVPDTPREQRLRWGPEWL